MTSNKTRAVSGDAGLLAARNQTPAEWLEADYDKPDAFKYPIGEGLHTPFGLFQVKPGHPADCRCETGESEFWLQADAAMKWRAPSEGGR